MDNNTFTYALPNSKESRAGAKACYRAMQDIERIMSGGSNSRVNYEKKCNESEQKMIKAAESGLSPFMVGFITVFTEYLCVGGTPVLGKWIPFVAMTKAEATAERNELWKEEKAKVISLCAFRNK